MVTGIGWLPWRYALWMAAIAAVLWLILRMFPRTKNASWIFRETSLIMVLYALWQYVGSLDFGDFSKADQAGLWLAELEQNLYWPSEAWIQAPVLGHEWLMRVVDTYYSALHIPVFIITLIWVLVFHRRDWNFVRTTTALLTGAGIDYAHLFERDLKELPVPGIGISGRRMMQTLGTEWGRSLDTQLWVRVAAVTLGLNDLPNSSPVHDRIVLTDVRFPNEAEWIRSLGGYIWRVVRPAPAVAEHVSEQHINQLPCDLSIHNSGTLEDLHEGRLFGEQAFVERTPRPSAAVAIAESECYAINRREFLTKLQQLDGERMRALRNLLLFAVRVPMFDARGVRVKPELAADILKQIAALCVSDLALSLTRTKEPLINLVAEQLRFEVERRLPRELRAEPPPPPPSPLRDKLAAKNAAPATRVAPAAAAAPVPRATAPSAAPASAAQAKSAHPSFDLRKI